MISIIIPVYRSEQTLERCIRSICKQTCTDWEAIIIVDGPPDASGLLADRLAESDQRIRVIHQSNQGVSAARNTGIQYAKGAYIQFLDSDDYLPADALESMLDALEDGKSDMVIAGFHHLYFGSDVVKLPTVEGTFPLKQGEEEWLTLYEEQFLNMPWNKLYKRELIKESFPLQLTLGEDLCFNLSYMEQIQCFTVLRKAVCNYIQDDRGTTLSTQRRMDRMETARVLYEKAMDFCGHVFPGESVSNRRIRVLTGKIAVEYLDAMENLIFELPKDGKRRREEIRHYLHGWRSLQEKQPCKPELRLLDYQVIYFFFERGCIAITDCLIVLRGMVVKLLRR